MLRGHHFFCAALVLCAPAWAEPELNSCTSPATADWGKAQERAVSAWPTVRSPWRRCTGFLFHPGREVTSLASAFKIAGASTVIASHWEVDDEVTRELFESFYRHLAQGRPRGEALRLARRETARQHPHPYYWAAFSLYGNPR